MPAATRVNRADAVLSGPLDQVYEVLGYKLVDVVVVAVVYAVDVA
jgi:hypothetical protein